MQYDDLGSDYHIKIKEGAEEKIKTFLNERGYEIEKVVISDDAGYRWIHEGEPAWTINGSSAGTVSASYGTLILINKNGEELISSAETNSGGFFWVDYWYDDSEKEEDDDGNLSHIYSYHSQGFLTDFRSYDRLGIKDEDLADFRKLLAEVVEIKEGIEGINW